VTAAGSRVSTKDKGQDTENQLRQLRDFCFKQGYEVVHEYVGRASGKHVTASSSRREFDAVLFWALDSFSREGVFETLQYLQRLTSYGVGYRSFTEQYLDSCGMFRDAVISVATIAKQEWIRLSERTIAGLERAKARGFIAERPRVVWRHAKPPTTPAPLGGMVKRELFKAYIPGERTGCAGLGS